jgi:hypothetical protein
MYLSYTPIVRLWGFVFYKTLIVIVQNTRVSQWFSTIPCIVVYWDMLKIGGGPAYNLSSDKAAIVA